MENTTTILEIEKEQIRIDLWSLNIDIDNYSFEKIKEVGGLFKRLEELNKILN